MTKQQCQDLHIDSTDDEWLCKCTNKKISRWVFSGYQSMAYYENPNAIDQMCEDCEIPNQD